LPFYVLVTASEALGQLPVIKQFPAALRRLLVLLIFAAAILALSAFAPTRPFAILMADRVLDDGSLALTKKGTES